MLPPPCPPASFPGEKPPEGSPVSGPAAVGLEGAGAGVVAGRIGAAASFGACEQAGSPGAQEVARAAERPGAGGPDVCGAAAETAVQEPKKSIIRRVADIATDRFRCVDL